MPSDIRLSEGAEMLSLTHIEATGGTLSGVRPYDVDLDLTGGGETPGPTAKIISEATPGGGAFLGLRPRALHSVTVVGRTLNNPTATDGRLALAGLAERIEVVTAAGIAYATAHQVDPVHPVPGPLGCLGSGPAWGVQLGQVRRPAAMPNCRGGIALAELQRRLT